MSWQDRFLKMSPEELEREKRALDKYIDVLKDERYKIKERKKRMDEHLDRQIKERDNLIAEAVGTSELIRIILNDECPFEEGPEDGEDTDWTDDEKLLLPMHLGGSVRTIDEYRVPDELKPDTRYALATVMPY